MIRFIVQFFTILVIYLTANTLVKWLNLPVPGSIVGMALLFLALLLGVCKLSWVEMVAQLHVKHITLLFIPFAVGILHYTRYFRTEGFKLALILITSSLLVLLVTAFTAEYYEIKNKRGERNNNDG